MKAKHTNNSFFDTSQEEKFILNHLSDFIQKEEMLRLPIFILYRILAQFYKEQENSEKIQDEVITFLFQCLDKYGKPASVLFNILDFKEQKIDVVHRLLQNYSDTFDFNMINHTLSKTVTFLTSEISKQKEEYSNLFNQMQATFQEQLEELKTMKKQEEEKQKQNKIDDQNRIEAFSSEIKKIKADIDRKMESIEVEFQRICKKQKELIDNGVVRKYHQMILETITFGQFRKCEDKLKDHLIRELFEIENKQKNENELLRTKLLLDLSSKSDSCQIVDFLRNNEHIRTNIKLTNDQIEYFYQKGQLDSSLTDCVIAFNELFVEIEYPCNQFEQKMNIISDIKMQNEQEMKVSITIKDKSYFEDKSKWSKIINISKVTKSINLILYNITDSLYQTKFFNSTGLISYINECSEIIFEIQYPSTNFSRIYHSIIGLKQKNSSKIKISIFYSQLETTDKHFGNNKDINYLRFDSNIKRTPNDGNDSSGGSFENCSSLIEVCIPSSLEKIGNRTFSECRSLQKISFEEPSSVISIGNYAFHNCTSLTQMSIPSSVTSIGNYAFHNCTSLTQITIPSSVTSIGERAFHSCTSLTQITISSSVTSVGYSAFYSCPSLTQIRIHSSLIFEAHKMPPCNKSFFSDPLVRFLRISMGEGISRKKKREK